MTGQTHLCRGNVIPQVPKKVRTHTFPREGQKYRPPERHPAASGQPHKALESLPRERCSPSEETRKLHQNNHRFPAEESGAGKSTLLKILTAGPPARRWRSLPPPTTRGLWVPLHRARPAAGPSLSPPTSATPPGPAHPQESPQQPQAEPAVLGARTGTSSLRAPAPFASHWSQHTTRKHLGKAGNSLEVGGAARAREPRRREAGVGGCQECGLEGRWGLPAPFSVPVEEVGYEWRRGLPSVLR